MPPSLATASPGPPPCFEIPVKAILSESCQTSVFQDPSLLEGTRGQEVVPRPEEKGTSHRRQVEEKILRRKGRSRALILLVVCPPVVRWGQGGPPRR